VGQTRVLSDEEIKQSTGARAASERASSSSKGDGQYEVQLDGAWVAVDFESYERVRQIQDSCA
jgi:hypothetical protein